MEFSEGPKSASNMSDPKNVLIGSAIVDISMEAAILSGLSRPLRMVNQQKDVQCPTATCIWPQFHTLGACHKCKDLTKDLKKVDNFGNVLDALAHAEGTHGGHGTIPENATTAFVLGNGHSLANVNTWAFDEGLTHRGNSRDMTSFGTGNPNKTNTMQDIDTLIWSLSFIHMDEKPIPGDVDWPAPLRATECALYYCGKTINATVDGNKIVENVTEDDAVKRVSGSWLPVNSTDLERFSPENIPPDDEFESLEFHKLYSANKRDRLRLSSPVAVDTSSGQYELTYTAVQSISAYFQKLFKYNFTESPDMADAISKVLGKDAVGFNGGLALYGIHGYREPTPLALEYLWHPIEPRPAIPDIFTALATSMTSEMRINRLNIEEGFIGVPRPYYIVVWGWIALHGFLLAADILVW